jgi:hypothetical protein
LQLLLSVQIAWRRRAIGGARDHFLTVPARTRQPKLNTDVNQHTEKSLFL